MTIKVEGGKRYTPKDTDEVKCLEHNFTTTWGALDPIQQLAVQEGIDTLPDSECILKPKEKLP